MTEVTKIQICVRRLFRGSEHFIEALPSWQVSKLKDAISEQTGILNVEQRLTFRMQPLEDARTLSDYDMGNECEVLLKVETIIPVHVAIFLHPLYFDDMDCNYGMELVFLTENVHTKIADIKAEVRHCKFAMVCKMFFEGRLLDDNTTLAECGVQSNDVLCIEGIPQQLDSFLPSEPGRLTVVACPSAWFSRHDVPAKPTDTIGAFKMELQRTAETSAFKENFLTEYPPDGQHLFHGGQELLDYCTLAHYRINIGTSILYLRVAYKVVEIGLP